MTQPGTDSLAEIDGLMVVIVVEIVDGLLDLIEIGAVDLFVGGAVVVEID